MNSIASTIEELHAAYQRLHGEKIPISHLRERAWYRWAKAGLTVDDLRRWYYAVQIQQKKGSLAKLTFRCLIGNGQQDEDEAFERAEENCLELRRQARGSVPDSDRASVMRQTGRTQTRNSDTAKPAGDVAKRLTESPEQFVSALAKFKQANKEIGL